MREAWILDKNDYPIYTKSRRNHVFHNRRWKMSFDRELFDVEEYPSFYVVAAKKEIKRLKAELTELKQQGIICERCGETV